MPRYALPVDDAIRWEMEDVVGEPGKWTIKTEQDEEPILEHNLALQNSEYTGDLTFGRHVASIPKILWSRWLRQYPILKNANHDPEANKLLFKLINEHPKLKVNNERLGKALVR